MPKSPDISGNELRPTHTWYERLSPASVHLKNAADTLNKARGRDIKIKRFSDFYARIVGGSGIWDIISKKPLTEVSEDFDPHLLFQEVLIATCNMGDVLDPNNFMHRRMNEIVGTDVSQMLCMPSILLEDLKDDQRIEPIATSYQGFQFARNVEDQILRFDIISASSKKSENLSLATCERAVISMEVSREEDAIQKCVIFLERTDENSPLNIVRAVDEPLEMVENEGRYPISQSLFGERNVGRSNREVFLEGMEQVRSDEYELHIRNIPDRRSPVPRKKEEKKAA